MSIGEYKLTTIMASVYARMSTPMDTMFSEWLVQKMQAAGYSQSDFARRSGISRQAISNYVNQQRSRPDEEALKKIAKALNISVQEVFRAAGLLPPEPGNIDEQAEAITYRTSRMSAAQKRAVLAFINSLEQGDIEPAAEPPANGQLTHQPK